MIPWLSPELVDFPPASQALGQPNGLLAAGGALTPPWLLAAYRRGIFPWYEEPEPILWWSPDPRSVLFPEQVHVSRSLRRRIRRGNFRITADVDFPAVIYNCAMAGDRSSGTWITSAIEAAYIELHRNGHAHSVEVWMDGALVGGLYGVALGRVFFGESMFSRQPDASKLALVALCRQLQAWRFALIDCQVHNSHLASMGAITLPRPEFGRLLQQWVDAPAGVHAGSWQPQWATTLCAQNGE